MVKVILVLLYLWKGQVTLEQKPFDTMEVCTDAGRARVEELVKDPRFDDGLFAECVLVKVEEAKK